MRRRTLAPLLSVSLAAGALVFVAGARDARACGGCFAPPESGSVVTDHRMVLSVSSQQTTLYDQIRYSGAPSSFAWVLPISGTATVGLSADVLFGVLDGQTLTQIQPPPTNCPPPPDCGTNETDAPSAAFGGGSASEDAGAVQVTKEEVVGPYETVQLKSTDANALNDWLTQHGYAVPDDVKPIIAAYVTDHYDFLAMKLVPGQTVTAMRPVRVTTQGASPVLPLRMVTAGTGPNVGIALWILGDGRWEPQNFPFFHIETSDIVWDWASSSSNYKTLRTQKEADLGGRGWEVESSLQLYGDSIVQQVKYGGMAGGQTFTSDYQPETDANGTVTKTADQVRDDDMKTLFTGLSTSNVRVTRLRGDISHASLADDLVLQPSSDQSELSNIRQVTREQGQPSCPVYDPDTCSVVGNAPRDQAQAQANQGGSGGGYWSCATTPEHGMFDGVTLASMAAFLGLAVGRARRRRRGRDAAR
jgi:hypothetical protein